MDPYSEKAFRIVLVGGSLMVAFCLLCAMFSIGLTDWGKSDIYIKESISGTGSGSTLHEGRLSEASGWHNATISHTYDKTVDESGAQTQNTEFMMSGGDGSYWNYQRVWTEKDIAGHQSVDIRVGQISGSYYGKSGMEISYNEANESREEFESTITIDTRDGNASISFSVIQWQGAGEPIPQYDEETGNFTGYEGGSSVGKPVSISELDAVGQYLIEQVVKLKEPITTEKGWLEFCEPINRDVIKSSESGLYIAPPGFQVVNGSLVRLMNGTA